MASTGTTVKQVVTIKGLTRYGFQMEDGKFVNWSKGTKQTDKDKIVPGAVFEMELYVSEKGAHYLNEILGQKESVPVSVPVSTTPRPSVSIGRDFDKEARGKTRCALLQGLLANPSLDLKQVQEELPMIDILVAYIFGDAK